MARKTSTAVVTEDGRVTIPGAIRKRLGIAAGTTLRFRAEGGRFIAEKESGADPVSRVYGVAGKGRTEAIMNRLRGEK
jgi:AbrB family looped-hinge helix DNA binding protein